MHVQMAVAACVANMALAINEGTPKAVETVELGPREDCVRALTVQLGKVAAFGQLHPDALMLLLQVAVT